MLHCMSVANLASNDFVSIIARLYLRNKCNKMPSILCVTETCARDPTPEGKHLVGDYRHYRPLWGESKCDFLIKETIKS